MKTNIATTQKQTARLLQCGVSAESADMTLRTESGEVNFSRHSLETELKFYEYDDPKRHIEICPAWSLSRLLSLLPKEIDIDGYPYRISIYFENPDEPVIGNQWCLYYKPKKHNEKSRIDDVPMYAPDLIECAVQMIIWLINYGYKLNGIENGGEK